MASKLGITEKRFWRKLQETLKLEGDYDIELVNAIKDIAEGESGKVGQLAANIHGYLINFD